MDQPILRVSQLKTYFPVHKGLLHRITDFVRAVDGITFDVMAGKTLGVVGESGCGKSTMLRSIIGIIKPTFGTVEINGKSVITPRHKSQTIYRTVQMVFQNPYASLNPKQTIGSIVEEPLKVLQLAPRNTWATRVKELLEMVGLNPDDAEKFPYQFSGGQRQRIGIARALACNPKLLLLDEPVAALDVSIQAQILNLLLDLQRKLHLTYVFVSHDLGVIRYVSNRILVLRDGHMVEMAETQELLNNPLHPYTRALLDAVPTPDPEIAQARAATRNDTMELDSEESGTRSESAIVTQWKCVKPNHYMAVEKPR